ncbi:hypothetical protein HY441_01260 [Candidatus Microgenomates bacterium]|nr:hypothetical protein [Candidatus Microgenomates bacterium]
MNKPYRHFGLPKLNNKRGLALIDILVILTFLAVAGFIAYYVYVRQELADYESIGENSNLVLDSVPQASEIITYEDLDLTLERLDQLDLSVNVAELGRLEEKAQGLQ